MTRAYKRMNPTHYGSSLADIQIRLQITREIWIWISDQIFIFGGVCTLQVLLVIHYCYNKYMCIIRLGTL